MTAGRGSGLAARSLSGLVRGYQLTLSPLLGPRCRFEPSCSAYAYEAIRTHGALGGGLLTVRRLLRCQPFCRGGWDPVPSVVESPGRAAADHPAPGPLAASAASPDAGPAVLAGRGAHPC